MIDIGPLVAVAMGVVGFGFLVLIFRIQREIQMREMGETVWLAFCDWLAVIATVVSLLFAVLPLLLSDPAAQGRLPIAAVAMGVVLTVGWIPAALAHYRIGLGGGRSGPRSNPEPIEGRLVVVFLLLGIVVFAATYFTG